jgi:hypothetical protein
MTASTPTARVPSRLNSSYAARLTRSRPVSCPSARDWFPAARRSVIATRHHRFLGGPWSVYRLPPDLRLSPSGYLAPSGSAGLWGRHKNCGAGFVPPHRFPRGFPRLHHEINGRSASEVTAKLLVRTNVNGTRFTTRRCPRCGHLVDPPGPAEDDPGVVLDSLRREIRLLRETVAYLRGSLGSWARPGRLPVPCARHTSNGTGNLCHAPAVPSASYCETIVMQESATIRRRHEHYVGPQQAHFHIS